MTGHVFHPGHEALHGVTVVLELQDGRTVVGRYHDTEAGMLRLHDVALHDPGDGTDRADFLARILKFGVRVDQKFLAVPAGDVEQMRPLNQIAG